MHINVLDTFLFFVLTPLKMIYNFIAWKYVLPILGVIAVLFVIIVRALDKPRNFNKSTGLKKKSHKKSSPPPLPNESKQRQETVFCPVCKRHVNAEKLNCNRKDCPFSN